MQPKLLLSLILNLTKQSIKYSDSINQKNSHLKNLQLDQVSSKKELKSSAQRPKTERAFEGNLLERASDSEELLASEEHSQAQSLSVFPD